MEFISVLFKHRVVLVVEDFFMTLITVELVAYVVVRI